eukprot:6213392-Pleurochrysis_carterae.AAC.1
MCLSTSVFRALRMRRTHICVCACESVGTARAVLSGHSACHQARVRRPVLERVPGAVYCIWCARGVAPFLRLWLENLYIDVSVVAYLGRFDELAWLGRELGGNSPAREGFATERVDGRMEVSVTAVC